jgi:PAS domain S-box-containing protein
VVPALRALLVEDNPGERWLFSEILRSRGHQVIATPDAEAGWKAFEKDPTPLVVLDLMLPGADGLELCRRIRAHPAGIDAVILVITGKRDPDVLQSTLDAGADDYVSKPVDVPLLHVRLAVAERELHRYAERRSDRLRHQTEDVETRALLANLDEVVFALDPRSRSLLRVSSAAERILGRSAAALMADPALWRGTLYPPEVELREEELAEGRSVVHRWPMRMPDGTDRWVQVSVRGALDGKGELTRVHGALTDVTDSQRSQEELAARNKEMMTLYRISEITLTSPSPESAYEEILEELAKATGFPIVAVEQYEPANDRLVISAARGIPLEGGPLEIPVPQTLSGVAVRTGQPVIATDASRRPEMAHPALRALGIQTYMAFPLVVGHQIVGTLMLAHTEPIEPDRRLVRWVGSLATGVTQLLDRLAAADALRESERESRTLVDQLQQANRELESFAYSVSHDLRAPLRTMQGFAHALLQSYGDRLPTEARDYAQRIIASGRQAETLIRDLLAYSRLSFEQLELQPIELSHVIATAREQVSHDIDEAGAEVTVDGKLPVVRGQGITLIQVIANLISNAIKFVPVGRHPQVRIWAQEIDGFVRVWVEDNGVGIPPGQEERIFRVFERLSESAARPGTGIGLAIVRRGMERMGGRAGVARPIEGEGSRFWIDVPQAEGSRRRPWGRRRRDG